MAMAYLQGEDLSIVNGRKKLFKSKEKRKEKKTARKEKRAVKKTARKEKRTKIKDKIKKGLKVVGKVGLTPARAGFLLAVNLNMLKIAKRLEQAYKKKPDEIKKFWDKFGGNWDKLKSAINKGAKANINGTTPESELGFDPATDTAIASATPIIIAVIKLIKGLKTDKSGDDAEDTSGVNKLADALATDPDSKVVTKDEEGKEEEIGAKPFYKNPIVVGGLALAVLAGGYLLTKKK
jgi:hypothetical protein